MEKKLKRILSVARLRDDLPSIGSTLWMFVFSRTVLISCAMTGNLYEVDEDSCDVFNLK